MMATIKPYETAAGKRYRVRYRKPDGSQTDKRGFRTKKDAEIFAAEVTVKIGSGDYINPNAGTATIGHLGEQWLASRTGLKPSSRAVYESAWRLWVEPRWGRTPVGRVEHSDVQAWLVELSEGDGKKRKPKSPTLVRRCHDILAGVVDVAVKDRKVGANRVRGVSLPRKVAKEHVYLTHEQVEKVATAAGPMRLVVAVLAYTGLRWGEMSGLRARDVDLERRRFNVSQNAVFVSGTVVVGTPKTHQKRSVPFPPFLVEPLDEALADKGRDALVFSTASGGHLLTPTMRANSWWDKALESAGLPTMTIHDLRHTTASLAISSGANVKAVQKMLGHASAAMTLDTYADLFDDDLDAVAIRLDVAAAATVGRMWARETKKTGQPDAEATD